MNGTSLKSKSKLRRRDKMNLLVVRRMIVGIAVLGVMVLFSACAGVGVGANGVSLSGSVVSVDSTNHTVTLSVNGQNTAIKNVPDKVRTLLQGHGGKAYCVHVTKNGDVSCCKQH